MTSFSGVPFSTSISPGERSIPSSSEVRPRRRSPSTRTVRVPARAAVTARPNAIVVLPWLPSGLVTTTELRLPSEKSRFVRSSRSASETPRRSGFSPSTSGEVKLAIAGSVGISPYTGASETRPSSSGVSTFVVRDSRSSARPIPNASPSSRATASASRVRGKTGSVATTGRSSCVSFSELIPMSSSARSSRTSVTAWAERSASSASASRALSLMIGVPLNVWTLIAASSPIRRSASSRVVSDVAASAYTGTTASEMPKKISPCSASVGLSASVEVDS